MTPSGPTQTLGTLSATVYGVGTRVVHRCCWSSAPRPARRPRTTSRSGSPALKARHLRGAYGSIRLNRMTSGSWSAGLRAATRTTAIASANLVAGSPIGPVDVRAGLSRSYEGCSIEAFCTFAHPATTAGRSNRPSRRRLPSSILQEWVADYGSYCRQSFPGWNDAPHARTKWRSGQELYARVLRQRTGRLRRGPQRFGVVSEYDPAGQCFVVQINHA